MKNWLSHLPKFTKQTGLKVPILGIEACGKTTFAWGIGRTLIKNNWGSPRERDYWLQIDPQMLNNQPLDATLGQKALSFDFKRCTFALDSPEWRELAGLYHSPSEQRTSRVADLDENQGLVTFRTDLLLSTHDISGGDFNSCMQKLSRPASHPESDPDVRRFMNLLRASDGLIVVMDLARRILTREEFQALPDQQRKEHILQALAEQVLPLCRGLEMAMRVNSNMEGKPVIFAYTKSDIHGLSEDYVQRNLLTAYPMLIQALRERGVDISICCLSYEGAHLVDSGSVEFRVRGVDTLLTRLAVRLLCSWASRGNSL